MTRNELAWLLAQEARGAARALREKVSRLHEPLPSAVIDVRPSLTGNLDALEDAIDAIDALSELPDQTPSGRRSRVDLASLVGTLAPRTRMSLAPGSGTEVFANEADLRRMLHVLLCPTQGAEAVQSAAVEVEIRGEADFVKVSVPLGPDPSTTAELERRWLARMALRLGGRLELTLDEQVLCLPTGGVSAQQEVRALRQELAQAQQQGEAYARELAEVFASSVTPPPDAPATGVPVRSARLESLRSASAAVARRLAPLLEGLHQDLRDLQANVGASSPLSLALAHRAASLHEMLAELSRVADCPLDEPSSELSVGPLCQMVAGEAEERAARHGVRLELEVGDEDTLSAPAAPLTLLIRSLFDHGIAATPREASVRLRASVTARGLALECEDGGPAVPVQARQDLLHHRVDPTSLGRPAGLLLLVIDAVAGALDATVELDETTSGGFLVRVILPRPLAPRPGG